MRTVLIAALALLAVVKPVGAHIGSPDVFFEGRAGEYPLLVVVRMPAMIPGVASIEVRALVDGARTVRVVPLKIRGLGSDLSPVPDLAERSADDPKAFRAQLWLMQRGAWRMHIVVDGDKGHDELEVPVTAVSSMTRPMSRLLQCLLGTLAVVLVVGTVAIVGAGVREGSVRPGAEPLAANVRRARVVMAVASAVVVSALALGDWWWRSVAAEAVAMLYNPPHLSAALASSRTLRLKLGQPNTERWANQLGLNELVPDHGHLMHLFLIREPGIDVLVHVHPNQERDDEFIQELPSMPGGRYRLYADVVHGTGFSETEIGDLEIPDDVVSGLPDEDDSLAVTMPFVAGPLTGSAWLSHGAQMLWLDSPTGFQAGQPLWLKFRVIDRDGRSIEDLEPYMGMAGHLVVVRVGWKVFARLHPSGTPPIAAVELSNGSTARLHDTHMPISAELTFPYGFPEAGRYRLFVQIKRSGRIETAVFDAQVSRYP